MIRCDAVAVFVWVWRETWVGSVAEFTVCPTPSVGAFARVHVDAVRAAPVVGADLPCTFIDVDFAIFAGVASLACARVAVDAVVTASVVGAALAWRTSVARLRTFRFNFSAVLNMITKPSICKFRTWIGFSSVCSYE